MDISNSRCPNHISKRCYCVIFHFSLLLNNNNNNNNNNVLCTNSSYARCSVLTKLKQNVQCTCRYVKGFRMDSIFLTRYSIILWCYFSHWKYLTSIKLPTRKWRDQIHKMYWDKKYKISKNKQRAKFLLRLYCMEYELTC
jgi:hypothetical protein